MEVQRPKTGVEFYTFIAQDGITALKAYLNDARDRGVKFSYSSPLFVTEKGKEPIEPQNLETMVKEVAIKSGLMDYNMNGRSFNPLGIHALRESFGSIMINTGVPDTIVDFWFNRECAEVGAESGVPDTIVDFWLGHSIGEMVKAYKSTQFESLKKMYLKREN
ncbi:MAG: tyrosine-type recombinase/integrase, partial [Candidatus Bathyarchaeota archaeon]